MIAGTTPGGLGVPASPYPSGTVIPSFYAGGATLIEVRVTHPLAKVEAVEDSLVGVGPRS